jgi:hypothetical protein
MAMPDKVETPIDLTPEQIKAREQAVADEVAKRAEAKPSPTADKSEPAKEEPAKTSRPFSSTDR